MKHQTIHEYQILPHDYYVKDYFLAKSLLYVLRYMTDDILLKLAIDEAAQSYKIPKEDIIKHVQTIHMLYHDSTMVTK